MSLGKKSETIGDSNLQGIAIRKTDSQKLLGVIVDQKLFEEHLRTICQRDELKLANKIILSITAETNSLNSFIKGQCNICVLIRMFSSREQIIQLTKYIKEH